MPIEVLGTKDSRLVVADDTVLITGRNAAEMSGVSTALNPYIYVMNPGYLIRLDPETGATLNYRLLWTPVEEAIIFDPSGGTIGADGNLYISGSTASADPDPEHGLLAKLDPALNAIESTWGGTNGPWASTCDVAFSFSRKKFYVAVDRGYVMDESQTDPEQYWEQPLLELDLTGAVTAQIPVPAWRYDTFDWANEITNNPTVRLAMSRDGNNLYYSAPNENSMAHEFVHRLNLSSREDTIFADVGPRTILGLNVGPSNRLYVTYTLKGSEDFLAGGVLVFEVGGETADLSDPQWLPVTGGLSQYALTGPLVDYWGISNEDIDPQHGWSYGDGWEPGDIIPDFFDSHIDVQGIGINLDPTDTWVLTYQFIDTPVLNEKVWRVNPETRDGLGNGSTWWADPDDATDWGRGGAVIVQHRSRGAANLGEQTGKLSTKSQ